MIILGIGSNLGTTTSASPLENCNNAVENLKNFFLVNQISKWYESEPIPKSNQNWFVNGVVQIKTSLNEFEVIRILQSIEKEFGRSRKKKNEPRILDLDIIAFNNKILNKNNLVIPHPRMHLRKFVLLPLRDINPYWVHPVLKMNVNNLIQKINIDQKINIIVENH